MLAVRYSALCVQHHVKPNSGLAQLFSCGSVKRLDLSSNVLGKKGLRVVFHLLKETPEVEELHLRENYISNELIKEFVEACVGLHHLRIIDLRNNPISHSGGKQLRLLVQRNPHISAILLDGTLINPALARSILKIAESNAAAASAQGTASKAAPSRSSLTDAEAVALVTPVALMNPGPEFKSLSLCYDAVQRDPLSVSETHLTTTKLQGLGYLMKAAASGRESPLQPSSATNTPSRSPRNAARPGAKVALLLPNHMRSLALLQQLPTDRFPALRTLLVSAFGSPTALFPALQVLRARSDIELREYDRLAVNLLLHDTFGDPLPALEDLVTHCPVVSAVEPLTPVNYPPPAREQFAAMWNLKAALEGADGVDGTHGALRCLLDVIVDHPMDELRFAAVVPEANAELVRAARKRATSEKRDEQPSNASIVTSAGTECSTTTLEPAPPRRSMKTFEVAVPWDALRTVFVAASEQGDDEGGTFTSLDLLRHVVQEHLPSVAQ